MWKVEYGEGKVQWFDEKTNLDEFTKNLKEKGIKFKVSKGTPEEYPSEKKQPEKDMNKEILGIEQPTPKMEAFLRNPDKELHVQIRNPKSNNWVLIDKAHGRIVKYSKRPFRGIKKIKTTDKIKKNLKIESTLNEFEAEIISKTGVNIVIRNEKNGKKYWMKNVDGNFVYDPKSPSKMPPAMEKSVLSVLRKINPEELKKAYGDDFHPVDISIKGNNLLVVPDKGRPWKIPLPF